MITNVIRLLQSDRWYNVSAEVEIAKGRYEIIDTVSKFKRHILRLIKSKYYGKEI